MRTLELHILPFMLISFSSFAQEQGDWRMQPVYNKDGVQVGLLYIVEELAYSHRTYYGIILVSSGQLVLSIET